MDSENQLVVKSDPDIKLEIDIAADLECPFGPQQQCECTTSDSSENRGSSALTPHETDCWNPSDAAMKSEPASQPAMKSEPANQPAMKSEPASQPAMKSEPTSQPALSQPINHESTSQPTMTQPTSQSTFVEKIKAEPIDYTDDFIQPASQSAIVQGFKAEPDEHSGPFTSADLPSLPRTVKSEDSELNCLDNRSKVKLDWQSESNDADIICKTESVASDLRSNIFKIEIDVADTSNDVMAEEVTTNISGDIKTEPIPSTISSDVTTTDMINISDDIKTESCEPIPSTINSDDTAISGDIKTESCQCIPSTINSDDTAISCDIKTESCECIPSTISSDVTTTDMTESDITTTDMTTLNSNITTIEAAMTDVSSDVQTEAETDTMNFVSVISSRDEQRNRAAGDKEKKGRPVSTDKTSVHTSAITAGPLVMLNRCHVCQRCSAAFVLVSSWKQHMASAHGEKMLPVCTSTQSVDTQSADISSCDKPCNSPEDYKQKKRKAMTNSSDSESNFSDEPEEYERSRQKKRKQSLKLNRRGNHAFSRMREVNCEYIGEVREGNETGMQSCEAQGSKLKQKHRYQSAPRARQQKDDSQRKRNRTSCSFHNCPALVKKRNLTRRHRPPSSDRTRRNSNTSASPLPQNQNHVCRHCSAAFVLFSSLKLHASSVHGETLVVAVPVASTPGSCDIGNSNKLNAKERVGNHGDGNHVQKERYSVEGGKTMKRKKGTVGGRKTVERAKVVSTDTDKIDLKKNSKRHVCDVCNKAFIRPSELKRHMMIHRGQKPFVCDVCSQAFREASKLKIHMTLHSGQQPFVCNVCSKAFTQAGTLKAHMTIHSGQKPFVCNVCSKAFNRASQFKTHKRIHTEERPYKCPHCDADFNYSDVLQTHIRAVHAGDRPYICQVCGAAFSRASSFRAHRMIHKGEKPHTCTVCGKQFTQRAHLRRHALVHSGKKPHTCPYCPAAFRQSGHLKAHVHKLHQ